jgi:hypothetical protein
MNRNAIARIFMVKVCYFEGEGSFASDEFKCNKQQ